MELENKAEYLRIPIITKKNIFEKENTGVCTSAFVDDKKVIAFGECVHSWEGIQNDLLKEIRFFDTHEYQLIGLLFVEYKW